IKYYQQAAEITPNLTFLYIYIGANYRVLEQYDLALEYFSKAADINKQLDVKDPIPYLSIAKTYSRTGEFFIAAKNILRALEFNPYSQDIYGQLGIVYFRSRNYEGAIEAFKCAVTGCTAEESCTVRQCDPETEIMTAIEGMPLTGSSVVYYYTYGSALAGMHRPNNNYCEQAMEILRDVKTDFSDEVIVMDIVQSSESICASFGIFP
ncbi:MAG: tetratricopeptide repeat protein, partial [Anaerolineaceae bacterium]|nr:tetratricopeptide repeat protein [Anaerolineaceae bacterium]